MDVKDFISESLKQIIAGIKTAQEDVSKDGGIVSPDISIRQGTAEANDWLITYQGNPQGRLVNNIDFDIAVTVTEQTDLQGGLGISVAGFKIGAGAKNIDGNTTLSRIKFKIPVVYPLSK
jgi:hypothetical protein